MLVFINFVQCFVLSLVYSAILVAPKGLRKKLHNSIVIVSLVCVFYGTHERGEYCITLMLRRYWGMKFEWNWKTTCL